ncbi:MAG: alpha/beta fold hydrolase [Geminicoccaceae bacterium]
MPRPVLALLLLLPAACTWLPTADLPRSQLEAVYLQAPTDYLDVDGIRLHVRDTGPKDAPVVILLHGFASSLDTWDAWAAALVPEFRVVRLDLPGFGLTGPDPTGDYRDARAVVILADLMDRLGIERADLIGNSMGGRIAWTFAALHPERVDRLVLISPDGFASPGFAYGEKPDAPAAAGLFRWFLPEPLVRAGLDSAYGDPSRLGEPVVIRYRDLMLAPGVRDAVLARLDQTVLVDPVPLLQRIEAPTLILWGEQDRLIPIANAAAYLQAIPDARLVKLPNLGHVPQEESPAVSLAPVRAFLNEGGIAR